MFTNYILEGCATPESLYLIASKSWHSNKENLNKRLIENPI